MKKLVSTLAVAVGLLGSASAYACPDALKFMKRKLNSQETVNLCQAYEGKTVLVVNTASFCGFTPQFEGLEAMYDKYRENGFVILGFPSNDFNQEADDESKTAEVCELTYGVEFPMFEPTSVKGDDADPLFRILARETGESPSWNFNKYLISRDGKTIKHYGSRTKPSDKAFVSDIEADLAL
ncbi:glutathione peroxidase [Alteromonas sediminis]|uniref:Glutathione peroxidase n=1 Tax=Alteromonas sediminis TaxID=2259342 RepID=A0A3N5ZCA5_9ALTE|nr:glutathione peroxidase [Alteromonas sediminis]RPJ67488.1 glutathione peroxidase [Alteromonas sediminis]